MDPATIMMLLQTVGPMLNKVGGQKQESQNAFGNNSSGILSAMGGMQPLNPQMSIMGLLKKAYDADRKQAETTNPFGFGTGYKKGGIHIKKENRGLLHKNLGVPQGKKLTSEQIAVKPGDSPAVKKRKIFAQNARKWNRKEGGFTSIMETLKYY